MGKSYTADRDYLLVSPLINGRDKRFGFSLWKIEERRGESRRIWSNGLTIPARIAISWLKGAKRNAGHEVSRPVAVKPKAPEISRASWPREKENHEVNMDRPRPGLSKEGMGGSVHLRMEVIRG
jgi:hypothetical protein